MAAGAKNASAAEYTPNSHGPSPAIPRAADQTLSSRERSARTPSDGVKFSHFTRRFIGHASRNALKPQCISAISDRASARAFGSPGQRPASGCRSASPSAMAMVSDHCAPSWARATGTVRAGAQSSRVDMKLLQYISFIWTRTGRSKAANRSQPRKLHEE